MTDPIKVADQDALSHKDWLIARRDGIGSSDAAGILGLSPWSTRWQIWLDKTGQIPPDNEQSEAMYFGNLLEENIVQAVSDRTGWQIERPRATYQHGDHPFMLASPDAIATMPDGTKALLEIKNTGGYKLEEWANGEPSVDGMWEGGEAPAHYIVQVQHQHAVMGTTVGYIGALLGGNRLYIIRVDRDDELIDTIIAQEKEFWNEYVNGDGVPEIDGTETTTDLLTQVFSESDPDASVEFTPDVLDALAEYQKAASQEKEVAERKRRASNILRESLGEAETGMAYGVSVITWKPQVTERFDAKQFRAEHPEMHDKYVKKSESRVLRVGRSKDAKEILARIEEEH